MAEERVVTIRLQFRFDVDAGRRMAEGAIEYARAHTAWRLVGDNQPADASLGQITSSVPGIVVEIAKSKMTMSVVGDVAASARLAADHFRERGFKHFAGAGLSDDFAAALRDAITADATLRLISVPVDCAIDSSDLLSPPRPLAVICATDFIAATVAAQLSNAKLRVPQDVAVLGTGDDVTACELAATPLSSIDLNLRLIGFQAARQLDRLLRRRTVAEHVAVPPLGVTLRASTDVLAIEDDDLAAAVRFLRANAHRPIDVADVLRDIPLHRRALERRFRKYLGRSPAEELRHCRVGIAKQLLTRSDLPMTEIAPRAGFMLPQHLATAFKQIEGMTPSAYREQFKRK